MFNLLISGIEDSWETDQLMRMMASRFKTYSGTEGESIKLDQPHSLKALEQVRALLMYEPGLPTSDIVRYGYVRDIRLDGSDLVFRFIEHGRLTRSTILAFERRLGIREWEQNNTHWALKDGDIPSGLLAMVRATFHVFLSHNSHDKSVVRELKERLASHGLSAWLDEDELRPGMAWQEILEEGIERSQSIAILIGSDGLGPWENEEMRTALRLAVADKIPIIPVLLPGTPTQPNLPPFLGNRTWVDLRNGLTDEHLHKLIWGITGIKP